MAPMNARLLRPLASGFDPRRIAALAVWLDSADLATLFQNDNGTTPASAASDPVGYWGDKSGNGRHATQGTANNRPTVSVSGNAARISFDGSNDVMQNFSLPAVGAGNFSMFLVCATNNTSNFRSPIQIGRGANSAAAPTTGQSLLISQDGTNNDGTPVVGRIGGNFLDATAPAFTSALKVFTCIRSSSTVFSAWIDGTATTPATGDPTLMNISLTGFQLGAATVVNLGTIQYWNGLIAELLIYNAALTNEHRVLVDRYLARKWGASLA